MSEQKDVSRRDFVKTAGAAAAITVAGAPFIQKARAANDQVQYGFIGTGSRGQYLLKHLKNTNDVGRCVAVCDVWDPNLKEGQKLAGANVATVKDYRELLTRKDIDAVLIATPLYTHFPITRDAILAGKHTFCEKSMVFKAEEVHALRKLAAEHPKQTLQVGLQRRYSKFYQTAKQMVDKGMIGKVTHVYAQWNRNPGWTMKPDPARQKELNWRLFREFSGGLTAELASHQIDVADYMFGSSPEMVVGVGGNEFVKDGRTVYDNIQLILQYPGGRKMMYSSISTNKHLSLFGGTRTEFGERIMGTDGTIEITVGTDNEPALGLWYMEPGPAKAEAVKKAKDPKEKTKIAGASLLSTGAAARALPILFEKDQVTGSESFLEREMKFARTWLYSKGVMVPEEDRNPVDVELESFLRSCRTGEKPKADVEIGLADSTMVILANVAMDEGRRVYFNEMDKMGRGEAPKAVKKG